MDTTVPWTGAHRRGIGHRKPMRNGGTAAGAAPRRRALRCIAAPKASGRELAGARAASRIRAALADPGRGARRRRRDDVGIADDRDAAINANGIPVGRAVEWMREHDAIRGLPGAEEAPKDALFALESDILALAGLQGEINEANAGSIRATLVAEVANGGTTPAADVVLADRGVVVIPDIICTAGGTVLGYFEWVQDMQAFFWTESEITDQLDRIVDAGMAEVQAIAAGEQVDLRAAAMMVAVSRVADATTLRGLYP